MMAEDILYSERVSSNRTEVLFLSLMSLFLLLFIWRLNTGRLDMLAAAFFCLFGLFLFYALNFRTLTILLTPQSLKLVFGIFKWIVPLGNVEECRLDDISTLMRMGGAGIHFMIIHRRYRASFNFLEYPRVVITLKRKIWLVRDISFSTRQPEDVLRHIREAISA